jgi:cysteine desulfurase
VVHYYFDHNATTPLIPETLRALTGALSLAFGNASSIHHYGQAAKQTLERSRSQIASLLSGDPREIVFTSGGTESNNLAILGAPRHPNRSHVITTSIEHPAVLEACASLERQGTDVTYIRPNSRGVVDPEEVRRALRPHTALISVMHVNNELGTIQPVEEISRLADGKQILMHSDGVQAAGRIPVDTVRLGVHLYSISAHKLYAPKGIGALFVHRSVHLQPILYGGRHERQRRPGTENVPGAAAFGAAADWALQNMNAESGRLAALRDRFERAVLDAVPQTSVNGAGAPRIPNTSNICFDGIEGEAMVIGLDLKGFAVSTGSACSSGAVEPSHVLTAIGLSRQQAKSSVRFSFGHGNTAEQVDALIQAVSETALHLRKLSPTYAHV